jgi:diguanylate cyclase (GGDEF)-like protein
LIRSPLVSVRLLDPTRTRLVATCRTGSSLHRDREWRYRLGEGLVGWVAKECEPLRLGHAEEDERFLHRDDQERELGSFIGVPIVSRGQCAGVLSAAHPAFDYFTEEHEKELVLLAALIAPRVEHGRRERIAQLDVLTGAFSRKALDRALPDALDEDVVPAALSVILVDVDGLPEITEARGREAGDRVLAHVAGLLHDTVRETDLLVRWGQDELLIVLPGATRSVAERVAARARARIEDAVIEIAESTLGVTASFGIAQRALSERRDAFISRAEQATRAAKDAGGNRVEVA